MDSDFNGDGFADVVIGESLAPPESYSSAGSEIHVLYGSPAGLLVSAKSATPSQFFNAHSPGMPPLAAESAKYGGSASGDFDGDCYADLAMWSYQNDDAGLVVLYGSVAGLSTAGAAALSFADVADALFETSTPMATGDFDGDGNDDLAVGIDEGYSSGSVAVIYGSDHGLRPESRQIWWQDSPGVPGGGQELDVWATPAAGDLTGDGIDDLIVGAWGEDFGEIEDAGTITLLRGSPVGLTTIGAQVLHQDSPGVVGVNETNDHFGGQVKIGDVTGDGRPDVLVGSRGEAIGGVESAGSLTVLIGDGSGLTGVGSQAWSQDTAGVPGVAEAEDRFGAPLSLGDINGDGRADVAIGTRDERVGTSRYAGSVTVLYGADGGLTSRGAELWTQDSPGVTDTAEARDRFGISVHAARVRSGPFASVVIGVPGERLPGFATSGIVHVLQGTSTGVSTDDAQVIRASDLSGVPAGSGFGTSVG